jgi:hypothetical protein
MATSSVDYEKVDMSLLQVLQTIKIMEDMILNVSGLQIPTGKIVAALDDYRNNVAIEIERQGSR